VLLDLPHHVGVSQAFLCGRGNRRRNRLRHIRSKPRLTG
jgi:hypothetical protein